MKKVFALLLTVAMTLSLTACRIVIDGDATIFHQHILTSIQIDAVGTGGTYRLNGRKQTQTYHLQIFTHVAMTSPERRILHAHA